MVQKDKINSTEIYFKEISKYPLLTPKQEVCLFKEKKDGEEELKQLLCRRKTKKLSQRIYYLKRKIHKYKQKAIKSNLRLVVSVAKSFSRRCHSCLSFSDLIQEGNLGLEKAVDKFKYEKGFKFSTFAPDWIIKYIEEGVAKVSRPCTWSLDKTFGEEDEKVNLIDVISDRKTPSPEDALLKIRNIGEKMEILSTILSEQEKTIIELRYDLLERGQILSLEEIGKLYGIKKARVCQIEANAIRKINKTVKEWRQEGKL